MQYETPLFALRLATEIGDGDWNHGIDTRRQIQG